MEETKEGAVGEMVERSKEKCEGRMTQRTGVKEEMEQWNISR